MRRSTIDCAQALETRGATEDQAAGRIGVARTTLRSWVERTNATRALRPRGRRPRHADRTSRRELLDVLHTEGTGIGVPELQSRFPRLARRELEELRARRAYSLRRRGRLSLMRLVWTTPGAVWATDFTNTPCHVDGQLGKLELVRDLASHEQLLATPSSTESAAEVRFALEWLFAEHGPPLVLKHDNGPGYIAREVQSLCRQHGVLTLPSPPYLPSYNGSCEAGAGSMKNRTARIAAAAGRPDAWTSDDVEAGRLQANACVRVGGPKGPTPDDLWAARRRLRASERARFLTSYRRHVAALRAEIDPDQIAAPLRDLGAIIDRRAIPKALVELGHLEVRRR